MPQPTAKAREQGGRWRAPELGEVQQEKDELAGEVAGADVLADVCGALQRKRLVGVELDEQHGRGVVLAHRLRLREEPPRVERRDEVRDRLALDADGRREHKVRHLERHRRHLEAAAVQHGGQLRHELADVYNDAGGGGGAQCGVAAGTAGDRVARLQPRAAGEQLLIARQLTLRLSQRRHVAGLHSHAPQRCPPSRW